MVLVYNERQVEEASATAEVVLYSYTGGRSKPWETEFVGILFNIFKMGSYKILVMQVYIEGNQVKDD